MNDTAAEASVRGAGGGTDEVRARREVIPFDSPAEDEDGFHVRTHRRPVHQRRRLRQGQSLTRLRLLVFPLIAGETGQEPAFARLPDIGLDLVGQSVLDGRIVLSEYRPSGVPPYAS